VLKSEGLKADGGARGWQRWGVCGTWVRGWDEVLRGAHDYSVASS